MTDEEHDVTPDTPPERRHESVDHEHPTDEGLLDPTGAEVPGTGIFGDETLVRDVDDGHPPGLYPTAPGHTGGPARPGPTPAEKLDDQPGE